MNWRLAFIAGLAASGALQLPLAKAEEPVFIGEVRLFPGPFCPPGWIEADGRQLRVDDYTDLFGLLGTRHGGDGVTTFQLPDVSAPATQAPFFGGGARLYQKCDFTGASVPLGLGGYRLGALPGAIQLSQVASVRLPSDWQITLYTGPDFDGEATTLMGDDACLGESVVNDVSSLVISRIAAPADVAPAQPVLTPCIAIRGFFPVPD